MLNTKPKIDPAASIILSSAEELAPFNALEVKQLDGLACYSHFKERTQEAFLSYKAQNPTVDERPYQWEYAAVACCRRHNIFGWAMGVGKTLSSLLVIYGLYKERLDTLRPQSIHIVVPSLLAAERWLEDLGRMQEFNDLYRVVKKEKDLETICPIIIYSQDFPKRRSKRYRGSSRNSVARILRATRPTLLIIDEVHGLRANTSRTKALLQIRQRSRRCLALTGTPSEGNLKELHSILHFVYNDNWVYQTAQTFSKQFGIQQRIQANYLFGKASSATNGPEKYLQKLDPAKMPSYYHLMRRYIHRVRIDEPQVKNCMTLPDSQVKMHTVVASDQQKQRYADYIKKHYEVLQRIAAGVSERHHAEALQLINPLLSITNHQEELGTSPKLAALVDIARRAKGKVVVFCDRVASAWLCKKHLQKAFGEDSVVRLYSQDNREEEQTLNLDRRVEIVNQFQYNPDIKAGVFSINLAGQSIDLTKASDVIYYCLPWSCIKIQQSISRVVRSGNPHPTVMIHYLATQNMIDEYQVNLAIEKIRCAKIMLDYEIDLETESANVDLSPSEVLSRLFNQTIDT